MVEYGTGFLWISAELVPIPLCINLFFCVNVLLYLLLTVVLFTLSQVLTDISAQTSVNDPMGEYSSKNIQIFFTETHKCSGVNIGIIFEIFIVDHRHKVHRTDLTHRRPRRTQMDRTTSRANNNHSPKVYSQSHICLWVGLLVD